MYPEAFIGSTARVVSRCNTKAQTVADNLDIGTKNSFANFSYQSGPQHSVCQRSLRNQECFAMLLTQSGAVPLLLFLLGSVLRSSSCWNQSVSICFFQELDDCCSFHTFHHRVKLQHGHKDGVKQPVPLPRGIS